MGSIVKFIESAPQNFLINGAFDYWQRGTSFTGITTNRYTADRWAAQTSSSGQLSVARIGTVPTVDQSGFQSNYGFQINCQTADVSVGSTDFAMFQYKMEGHDYAKIKGKSWTLSFWVRTNKTGNYGISFTNSSGDRYYTSFFTVNASNTWERKFIYVDPDSSPGSENTTNGIGLQINFVLMAGTNFQTLTLNGWQVGANQFGPTSQVNFLDSTSNSMIVTQIMLGIGRNENQQFMRAGEMVGGEMLLCQRYYEKSYGVDIPPGTPGRGTGNLNARGPTSGDSTDHITSIQYNTQKRATASITIYNADTGTSGQVQVDGVGVRSAFVQSNGPTGWSLGYNNPGGGPFIYVGHWTADAEL